MTDIASTSRVRSTGMPAWLTLLLAASCGIIVANLYYVQPLVGPIRDAIGLSHEAAGLLVTLTQLGYVAGLLLLVPLADLVENRRLIVAALALAVLGLLGAALSGNAPQFLASALLIGIGSSAAQILVPYAAHMANDETRGRVVGNVVGGLLLGIMLARPVASLLTDLFGWHAVFLVSAGVVTLTAVTLFTALPPRTPGPAPSYGRLLASMGTLVRTMPLLRRRALYQACQFGAFSLFWTVAPLVLSGAPYNLSQTGLALFALAGVLGAVVAPIAGRLADRGLTWIGTLLALLAVASGLLLTRIDTGNAHAGLALWVLAAVVLDMGVSLSLVLGQRAIYSLGAEYRGRLNSVFLSTLFLGGALGSSVGGWAFATGGWQLAGTVGLVLPVSALLYFTTDRRAKG